MKFYVGICVQIVLTAGLLGSVAQKVAPDTLLKGYDLCNKQFDTISYDLETRAEGGRQMAYTLKYCGNEDKRQWIGQLVLYDERGKPNMQVRCMTMWDGTRMIHLAQDSLAGRGSVRPPRALLWGPSRDRVQQQHSEDSAYGGPLVGKVFGSNYHSVYDLLKGASNVTLHDSPTKILDYDAYLLEADTQYGIVRAWISPEAGNNCLRWQIVKAQNQFYREGTTTNDQFTKWVAAYDVERIEQTDGRYITTQAKFEITIADGDTQISNASAVSSQ